MNVLHVGETDNRGGAARASYRLHRGLLKMDVRSRMLVQWRHSDDPTVQGLERKRDKLTARIRRYVEKSILRWSGDSIVYESLNLLPSTLGKHLRDYAPDLIHLHWIGNDTLSIPEIGRIDAPIVWTLHDMWPFRGIEHYSDASLRDHLSNGRDSRRTSASGGADAPPLDHWMRRFKSRRWKSADMTFVATTPWMEEQCRQSLVTDGARIERIPYGLDLNTYKPVSQSTARRVLNLPEDKQLLLFGALNPSTNPRKGFAVLQTALHHLDADPDEVALVIFGEAASASPVDFPLDVHYLGRLYDDATLALAYSSADVMIVPSILEAFGQTIIEAMACGVPVVTFDATGPGGIVQHKKTGYLAEPFEAESLTAGIHWLLDSPDRCQNLGKESRRCVEANYDIRDSARQYMSLYRDLLG
jgi:glycosyltransferase involved in cell wall biosynthesis